MRIEMEDGAEIENMYDAEGTLRQRKHIGSDDTEIAVTDYSGVWEFKNGALSRINIPGGYIQGDSVYFYIADQQGNIRQVWNASTGQTVQDNHYYPYGAMFGESAAVEYVNAMAGINNIASINAEVSANPYRYGGKEWLMQEGLNYYDFAARQYDPTTGRFIHPDPLNGKYPHLSSYLYCAGNPINATDPTGMAVIYDMNGAYVGTTDEGFTGGVYIYNGTTNIDFSEYTEDELKNSESLILFSYEELASSLSENVKQAIFNNILSHFNYTYIYNEMFHMSRIYGEGIEVIDINALPESNWRTYVTFRNGIAVGLPKIYGGGDFIERHEATVGNIVATLLVHEWFTHGIKNIGFDDNLHHLAYKNVIDWKPLWNLTTDRYKGFIMDHFKYYYETETNMKLVDYYYQNLYNKYIKFYQNGK